MTTEDIEWPNRAQRRYLRRLFNGRTVPIIVDGRAFLTFKDAMPYLKSLSIDARDKAYTVMKAQAK